MSAPARAARGPTGSGEPAGPSDGTVHGRQLRALLRVYLRELSRGGVDINSGVKGNQLVQISLSLGVLGLLSSTAVFRVDAAAFVHQMFATTWLLATLMILPESLQGREHKREILAWRPVGLRTHSVARLLHLLLLTSCVAGAFGIWPLGAACLVGGVDWWRFPLLLASLLLGVFATSTLWLALALRIGRRFGIERLRSVAQLVLILVSIAVLAPNWLDVAIEIPADIEIWLPSTWFADLALLPLAAWDAAQLGRAAFAVLFVAFGALVGYRLQSDVYYEQEASRVVDAGPKGLGRHLLGAARAIPGLGPWWLPRSTFAVADLLLRVNGREDALRLRGLVAGVFAALGGLVAIFDPFGALLSVTALAFALSDGLRAGGQNVDPRSAWLLHAAPCAGRHRVAALRWFVVLRYALLPMVINTAIAFAYLDLTAALLLAAAQPAMVYAILGITLVLLPVDPLSQPLTVDMLAGCLTGQGIGVVLGGGLAVFFGLTFGGWIGLTIGAILLLATIGAGALAAHGAAQRLDAKEFLAG